MTTQTCNEAFSGTQLTIYWLNFEVVSANYSRVLYFIITSCFLRYDLCKLEASPEKEHLCLICSANWKVFLAKAFSSHLFCFKHFILYTMVSGQDIEPRRLCRWKVWLRESILCTRLLWQHFNSGRRKCEGLHALERNKLLTYGIVTFNGLP